MLKTLATEGNFSAFIQLCFAVSITQPLFHKKLRMWLIRRIQHIIQWVHALYKRPIDMPRSHSMLSASADEAAKHWTTPAQAWLKRLYNPCSLLYAPVCVISVAWLYLLDWNIVITIGDIARALLKPFNGVLFTQNFHAWVAGFPLVKDALKWDSGALSILLILPAAFYYSGCLVVVFLTVVCAMWQALYLAFLMHYQLLIAKLNAGSITSPMKRWQHYCCNIAAHAGEAFMKLGQALKGFSRHVKACTVKMPLYFKRLLKRGQ